MLVIISPIFLFTLSIFLFKTHSTHNVIQDIFVHEFLSGTTSEYIQGGGSIVRETKLCGITLVQTRSQNSHLTVWYFTGNKKHDPRTKLLDQLINVIPRKH